MSERFIYPHSSSLSSIGSIPVIANLYICIFILPPYFQIKTNDKIKNVIKLEIDEITRKTQIKLGVHVPIILIVVNEITAINIDVNHTFSIISSPL
jgi:hypothetical protein